jgi:two-component sensor histidine kinase
MANTHSLLSRGGWQGTSLAELVRCELAPWRAEHKVTSKGPEVLLAAEAAQAMAMVLHELATNAAKYGALSTKKGRVSVHWRWGQSDTRSAAVLLRWQEKGGPPVKGSAAAGYGTSVIRDLIPYELGGSVDLAFADEGVRCSIEIPARWVGGVAPGAAEAAMSSAD